ncbi:MAG: DUF4263 domain-containing protein [Actinobacteria bacterium]|nr:DUF4263 domain-containing protein [Actinomycetota bacterium]
MSPFEVTYSLAANPPLAMPPQIYEERVTRAWGELLRSDPAEREVQAFLETHPSMVPGAHVGLGRLGKSGHAPFPGALIAQPPLRGLTTRTPDLLWIAMDSLYLNPIFVEIEAPGKRWVTRSGQQHNELTQALHQLQEWTDWFRSRENQAMFLEAYDIPVEMRRRQVEPIYLLIYGRQSEDPEAIMRLRRHLTKPTQFVVPYEHLRPDKDSFAYLTARLGTRGYQAVSIPPTITLGPRYASDWRLISGKEEAVAHSEWMSAKRRAFLKERFAYWDEWGRGERGLINTADEE